MLRIAFKEDSNNWRQAPVSLDSQIQLKVLKPRVLVDTNIVGGTMAIISLEGLTPQYSDTYTIVYEIPMRLCNFREIMSVLSIGYLPYATSFNSMGMGSGTINPNSMNDVDSAGQRMGDAMSNIPPISNGSCELVGPNTVLVRDQLRITNAYQLRCMLANDPNMSNINPRSQLYFADLCILATKAYIYNKMIVMMDQAYLMGGQELGAIKTVVEGYADANENYMTFLREVWQRISVFSDQPTHQRMLRSMISPGI